MTQAQRKTATRNADDARQAADAEVPEWATTDPAGQEMEKFVAPVDGQWRRPLSEHELKAWIAMQATMSGGDDEEVGLSMFAQVVGAATLEEALSGKVETTKSRDILETILECNSIKFVMSDLAEGCPYFAILDVRISNTGERETISLGGWMAVGQCGRMHYQSADLTADSPYLVEAGTPGAWAKESFPHYFKIRQKDTPKGHMNYLAPAMS